jgi:hypothetical protein
MSAGRCYGWHNFPEVVVSRPPRGHNFREVVAIKRASSAPILEVLR